MKLFSIINQIKKTNLRIYSAVFFKVFFEKKKTYLASPVVMLQHLLITIRVCLCFRVELTSAALENEVQDKLQILTAFGLS